jgi:hypothetical protein
LGFFPQKLKNGEPQMNAFQSAIATHIQIPVSAPPNPLREKVTILIISSPEGVRENIHELHQRGYAEASLWSGLLPSSNPGEFMSVLVRYRLI